MSKYVGQKFGNLEILEVNMLTTAGGNPRQEATVRCTCGNEYRTDLKNVCRTKPGVVRMCRGCRDAERRSAAESGFNHPLQSTWRSMIARCHDPAAQQYLNYGARGIKVCSQWRGARPNGEMATMDGFRTFCCDIGSKPSKRHSVGRIDNDGPYSPENCRWETPEQQANNTRANVRVTVLGETMTISQWSRRLGIGAHWASLARAYNVPLPQAVEALINTDDRRKIQAALGVQREKHLRAPKPQAIDIPCPELDEFLEAWAIADV